MEIEMRKEGKKAQEDSLVVTINKKSLGKGRDTETSSVLEYHPKNPYSVRFKNDPSGHQFKLFRELFEQLHIYIPLVEPLSQMP